MKIIVISNLFPPEFLGGYELGCAQMVTALRQRGHDVRVVTSTSIRSDNCDQDTARVLELSPIYNPARIEMSDPAVRDHFHLRSSAVNPVNTQVLARDIEDYKPDVAYLWNLLGLGGLGVMGLLRHLGVPWVWHIMDMIPRSLCGFGGDAVPRLARQFGTLFAGSYIVCSSHVAEEIRAGEVDLGSKVYLLPNWVTGDRSWRRIPYFSGGDLRVMTAVGVLGEHKGTNILIEAAARMNDLGFANFSVDIYGREDDPRFRAMAHVHELSGVVRFMGPRAQDEMLGLYAKYDLFAFPTWKREPFGFAPLEAASCGCVPLFSADCGIAEWLVDGVHCLKADRTVEAFALRIAQVLEGEVDLGAVGRRAQSVVCRDFHLDAVAPKVELVLEEAASERTAKRGPTQDFHKLARFADGLLPVLLTEAKC
jgi:glycogen synthase